MLIIIVFAKDTVNSFQKNYEVQIVTLELMPE